MKKLLIIALSVILVFQLLACSFHNEELPDNIRIRLSLDQNEDWGKEAISFTSLKEDDIIYVPKIVLLDTGCNVNDDMVLPGYNVLEKNHKVSDLSNHGTLITTKLLSLICTADIIPIKITESEEIEHSGLLDGMKKAISLQPDIISLSLGTKINYPDIAEIINDAINQNIIVVAAAGNQYGDELLYPAGYDDVISVLARDINNLDCTYNNKSEMKRSFSAPGEHIVVNDEYISGSSIAVSYVTAIISQMIALCGREKLNIENIHQILSSTAIYPTKYSYGLIQYSKAIQKAVNPN